MARAGYVNCNSCHISVNGGGILNDYGRELSKEELAVWKSKDEKSKEHLFAYGALGNGETPIQKWLKLGGDVRGVYYYVNAPTYDSGQTILMQADLQAAAVTDHWALVASGGASQLQPGQDISFLSRTHYLQYSFNDQFRLRGGKFIPAYGITTPDHITLTRSPLELGYNFESYNLEASYITDQWNWFLTGVFGRPDNTVLDRDKGFAVQGAYLFSERVKIGLNAWYGKKDFSQRWLFGGFGILGITEKLFASTEVDVKDYIGGDHGVASTQKISYILTDGLWIYGLEEYGTTNIPSIDNSTIQDYAIGVQFFPRTHFEFNVAYMKILNNDTASGSSGIDTVWFMSHYYL